MLTRYGSSVLTLSLALGCDFAGEVQFPVDAAARDAEVGVDSGDPARDLGPRPDAGPDAGPDPCGDEPCGPGERCEEGGGAPVCVPNTCEDLDCGATERCEPAPSGAGHVCVDNTCADDVDCPTERWCDVGGGGLCQEDTCTPGAVRCSPTEEVEECPANGAAFRVRYACGGAAYVESRCVEDGGDVYCPCQDDWDCPGFTECDVDRCEGTGQEPTCFLEPAPFTEVLPSLEPGFPWGGTRIGDQDATGSPFPESAQAVITPLVVNLDDDNGDGRIDERDFPEIVFMTFCPNVSGGARFQNYGVLRAVHGGGPDRGEDYFAVCDDKVWQEGDPVDSLTCGCQEGELDPTSTPAAGDIDGDGVPEIVVPTDGNRLQLFDNTGELLALSSASVTGGNQGVSIANVDGRGPAEIVVGRQVFSVAKDPGGTWVFVDRWEGSLSTGSNGQGPIGCVADLDGDGRQEVIAGTTAYRFPEAPAGADSRADCTGGETGDEELWCDGDLAVLWDGRDVNGSVVDRNGFCAVADVWGASADDRPGPGNPLDGRPEVVVVVSGQIQILDGQSGELLLDQDFSGERNGGAPNVDDFDGDGFPEIGTAFERAYYLLDLQVPTTDCPAWPDTFEDGMGTPPGNAPRSPPGAACATDADCGDPTQFACNRATAACVCLHNGWSRATEDDSSRVTGSSVFDFNGDGSAEVIYNDECFFRVYAGLDGAVFFKENSPSRTRTENPVVADVDNDGNAEIVFAASNESGFCSEGNDFNNGIEVWGDASDAWVGARRIYNQHSYHVTNVFESGGVPDREPESWLAYNERVYNSYRSQPRNPFILAPDLVVGAIQLSSPDAACGTLGTTVDITVRVVNQGDLRVGPGLILGFQGTWSSPTLTEPLHADAAMTPLTASLATPLEPGEQVFLTVRYDAMNNSPMVLPDEIEATIDADDRERECREDNNSLAREVIGGPVVPDLEVAIEDVGADCPTKPVETTVRNVGSVPASDIVVRYFAGNPEAGGTVLHEETVPGPLAPGASTTFTAMIPDFPALAVIIFAVVDPDDRIPECNDGNNSDRADERFGCLG
ncbi:MAG: FG-GAP-like repeat-containing protein [Sandaracinaceae bacterium]